MEETEPSVNPGHKPLKTFILISVVLDLFAVLWYCVLSTWNSSISLGLKQFIMTLIILLGHIPFHFTWESVQIVQNKHFLCTFLSCIQF